MRQTDCPGVMDRPVWWSDDLSGSVLKSDLVLSVWSIALIYDAHWLSIYCAVHKCYTDCLWKALNLHHLLILNLIAPIVSHVFGSVVVAFLQFITSTNNYLVKNKLTENLLKDCHVSKELSVGQRADAVVFLVRTVLKMEIIIQTSSVS